MSIEAASGGTSASTRLQQNPEAVLDALARRLEAALGRDPWALGHRAAALHLAAELVDERDLDAVLAGAGGVRYAEVAAILRRFLADTRDVRGLPID